MSKRFNKQNRGSKPPQNAQSNNMMSERKKKIYAYILAGFIIFWNIASVLGIIAFVRSFAKNDNSSEERTSVAVTQVIDDNDNVARTERVVRERKNAFVDGQYVQEDEPIYQWVDLRLEGATLSSSHLWDNYFCNATGGVSVRVGTDGSWLFVVGDTAYNLEERGTYYDIDIPIYALRITGGNPYFDVHQKGLSVKHTYSVDSSFPAEEPKFSGDTKCYVRFVRVSCSISPVTINGYEGSSITYHYRFEWYNNAALLSVSQLEVKCTGAIYHASYTFVYPFTSTRHNVKSANSYSFSCGRYMTSYAREFVQGYNYGVEQSKVYTFEKLLTNVIDVPIRAFTSLFEFDILGVNLAGFFFGLLSVCAVIAVIKLFL